MVNPCTQYSNSFTNIMGQESIQKLTGFNVINTENKLEREQSSDININSRPGAEDNFSTNSTSFNSISTLQEDTYFKSSNNANGFSSLPLVSSCEHLNFMPPANHSFANTTRRRSNKPKRYHRTPESCSQRFSFPSKQMSNLPPPITTVPSIPLCQPIFKQTPSFQSEQETSFRQQQQGPEPSVSDNATSTEGAGGLSEQMGAIGSEMASGQRRSAAHPLRPMAPPMGPMHNPMYPMYPMVPVGAINAMGGHITPMVPINQMNTMGPLGAMEGTRPVNGGGMAGAVGGPPQMPENQAGPGNGYLYAPPMMPPFSSWNGNVYMAPVWPPLMPPVNAPLPPQAYFPFSPADRHWYTPTSPNVVTTTAPTLRKNANKPNPLAAAAAPWNQPTNTNNLSGSANNLSSIPYSAAGK